MKYRHENDLQSAKAWHFWLTFTFWHQEAIWTTFALTMIYCAPRFILLHSIDLFYLEFLFSSISTSQSPMEVHVFPTWFICLINRVSPKVRMVGNGGFRQEVSLPMRAKVRWGHRSPWRWYFHRTLTLAEHQRLSSTQIKGGVQRYAYRNEGFQVMPQLMEISAVLLWARDCSRAWDILVNKVDKDPCPWWA